VRTDQPVPSIVFALLLCGAVLRLAEKVLPRDFGSHRKSELTNVPSEYENENESDEDSDSQETHESRLSQMPALEPRSRRRVFLIVVVCIVLRIETVRRIAEHFECTTKNLEVRYFSYVQDLETLRVVWLLYCV
jgi:hypothetical protein